MKRRSFFFLLMLNMIPLVAFMAGFRIYAVCPDAATPIENSYEGRHRHARSREIRESEVAARRVVSQGDSNGNGATRAHSERKREPPRPLPRRAYQIVVCPKLRLAYIHIFKNGGSALIDMLTDFCGVASGENVKLYRSWVVKERLTSFEELCAENICFTFWRDPVDRFLSGYHEVMRRATTKSEATMNPKLLLSLKLPDDATDKQKIANLYRFFELVESGAFWDPHTHFQTNFLSPVKDIPQSMSNLAVFDLKRVDEVTKVLFCGAYHGFLGTNASCPMESINATPSRVRTSDYGLRQYSLSESQLDDEFIERIAKFFCPDYCYFGIPMNPRAKQLELRSCCSGA